MKLDPETRSLSENKAKGLNRKTEKDNTTISQIGESAVMLLPHCWSCMAAAQAKRSQLSLTGSRDRKISIP